MENDFGLDRETPMDNDGNDGNYSGLKGKRINRAPLRISSIVELMQEEYRVKAALRRAENWIFYNGGFTRKDQTMLDMTTALALEKTRLRELQDLLEHAHDFTPAVYEAARTLYLDMQ